MSNICKTVTLRTRKIKGGEQLSFYLDYYPGYRDESTMKVMRHESLGIYIYAKPKNQREKDYNERMREKAEALRCQIPKRTSRLIRKRKKRKLPPQSYCCRFFSYSAQARWQLSSFSKRRTAKTKNLKIKRRINNL